MPPSNTSIQEIVKFTSAGIPELTTDLAKLQEVIDKIASEETAKKFVGNFRDRLALEARRAAVASGQYARELSQRRELARETEKVMRLEERARYQSQYGRFGGAIAYGAARLAGNPLLRAAAGATVAGGAAVTGLASRGFSGTVEGNRLATEFQMISRELAGAFRPAVQWATRALQTFRKFLERFSEREQNMLMLGGLVVGGLGAVGVGRMALGGLGLAGVAGRFGMGSMVAGVGGGALGIGHEVMGAAGAYGGLRAAFAPKVAGLTRLGSVVKGIGSKMLPVAGALTAYDALDGGYYSTARSRGSSRFTAGATAAGLSLLNTATFGYGADWFGYSKEDRARAMAERARGADPTRRMVTIADAGFEAPGSAYERLTTALAMRDAGEEPKSAESILTEIRDMLRSAIGLEKIPAPSMPAG